MTPEAASGLMNEALALQERNLHEQALELYARIVAHYPRHPDVSCNLGVALMQTGRFGSAEKQLLRALELRPQFAVARSNLVMLWMRMDRAQTLAEIVTDPQWMAMLDLSASLALAEHFHSRGELARTVVAAARAVEGDPSSGRAQYLLGAALLRLSRAEEAERPLREAHRLTPDVAAVMLDLARCLYAMQARSKRKEFWLEGRALIEAALRLDAGNCRAHHELGLTFEAEGEFAAAAAAFTQALSIAPAHLPSLSSLAAVSRSGVSSQLLDRLQTALSGENSYTVAENCRGWQTLGKCQDARAQFRQAFTCFERAKRLAAGDRIYQREHRARYCDNLIATYSRLVLQPDWPSEMNAERPLFIVGMPRSGTTLLEYLLARHPQIAAAGEVNFFTELERRQHALHTGDGALCDQWRERLLPGYRDELRAQFASILDRVSGTARYVIDKMPFNFWQLGMISCLYPGAKIIHCRRDALDVGLSCFIETFSESHDWSWRLADIAHYHRQYSRVMSHWGELFGASIHQVDYERLITNPDAQLRTILRFLALDWSDGLTAQDHQSRAIRTPSNWQVRQPMYSTSIGRSRNYAEELAPLVDALS